MVSKGRRSPRSKTGAAGAEGGQTKSAESPRETAKIDEVLQQLEDVVEVLESGDLPLEQALARFEEGVKLARSGGALLDAIEERVEVLLADGRGEPKTAPFEDDDEEEDDD
jgi:exodeoxyribonuclease VII small subunit